MMGIPAAHLGFKINNKAAAPTLPAEAVELLLSSTLGVKPYRP